MGFQFLFQIPQILFEQGMGTWFGYMGTLVDVIGLRAISGCNGYRGFGCL